MENQGTEFYSTVIMLITNQVVYILKNLLKQKALE